MRLGRIGGAIAVVAVLASACGGIGDDGPGSDGPTGGSGPAAIDHPSGSHEVVLRVAYQGGFVPVEYHLSSIPSWTLFGDGTLILQGPQIEIYPGPALPSLVATPISRDGVQAILRAARDAGLMDGDATYGNDCVADATTTVFTTNAGGRTSVVSAYALDVGEPAGSCGGSADADARRALAAFQASLGDLASWLPEGSVGSEAPYDPTEMRVFTLPYRPDPGLPQDPVDWPLDVPLDGFGEPVADGPTHTRCGVVTGADLELLVNAAQGANQLTPWTSDGAEHRLVLRPLLPDEHTC